MGAARWVSAVVAAGAVTLLAGCGSADEREWRVAGDPTASADDVISAGQPARVASGGGQTLVTYEAEPEDDEGDYSGAWRLYDKDDEPIADGRFKPVTEMGAVVDVWPSKRGFVLHAGGRGFHEVDRSGTIRALPKSADVATLSGQFFESELYTDLGDGADDWALRIPGRKRPIRWSDLPTDNPQGIAVDDRRGVWILMPWDEAGSERVAYSKDGSKPWQVEKLPVPAGGTIAASTLTASRGEVFLPIGVRAEGKRAIRVLHRQVGPDGTWSVVAGRPLPGGLGASPRVTKLPGGQLFVELTRPVVQRKPGGPFVRLDPPHRRGQYFWVSVDGSRLWAFVERRLYRSEDLGQSWTEFER